MRHALAALALGALAAQGLAQTPRPERTLAALREFQARDQRLQNVGWRLVRGNAAFCDTVTQAIGLQLLDTASFAGPGVVRAALGLSGSFAVQSVAEGSPAARSGALAPMREITRIGAQDPNSWPAGERLDWKRLQRAHDRIDAQLANDRAVALGFTDGSEIRVEPVAACATRFELLTGSDKAVAEGARVILGARFPGFAWEEDDVFAGVVAHELAHNLLRHREWLDRKGRKRRHVRLTEREADRLMPWLLANAGYDPASAHRFMMRWGKDHDLGLFRARTHDGWDERAEFIAAELPIIARVIEREGKADWAAHFRREIEPFGAVGESPNASGRD